MTDVDQILRALLPALALVACSPAPAEPATKAGEAKEGKGKPDGPDGPEEPDATANPDPEGDGEEPDPEPETQPIADPLDSLPTCPSTTACVAHGDLAEVAVGTDTVHDCPQRIQRPGDGKGSTKLLNAFGGAPGPELTLDQGASTIKRDEKAEDSCCYTWTESCPGGRPLLNEAGAATTAPLTPGTRTGSTLLSLAAEQWLADAAMEHASVASFSRAAIELMSVGAPAAFVRGCHAAALDELRHVEACLAMAERCGAGSHSFGALPLPHLRAPELARLAADTFEEGCVGETIAALAMGRAARWVTDEASQGVLSGIAADELRHAALAWEIVTWAVGQGGAPVLAAIRARAETLRQSSPNLSPTLAGVQSPAAPSPLVQRTGRLDPEEAAAAHGDAWTRIIEPLLEQLES